MTFTNQSETENLPNDFPARHAENKRRGFDIYRQMLQVKRKVCRREYHA